MNASDRDRPARARGRRGARQRCSRRRARCSRKRSRCAPSDPRVRDALARLALRDGDLKAAVAHCRAGLAAAPGRRRRCSSTLGHALRAAGHARRRGRGTRRGRHGAPGRRGGVDGGRQRVHGSRARACRRPPRACARARRHGRVPDRGDAFLRARRRPAAGHRGAAGAPRDGGALCVRVAAGAGRARGARRLSSRRSRAFRVLADDGGGAARRRAKSARRDRRMVARESARSPRHRRSCGNAASGCASATCRPTSTITRPRI